MDKAVHWRREGNLALITLDRPAQYNVINKELATDFRRWITLSTEYNRVKTRGGRVDAMNASVVISNLGAFGVRTGAPIVVPPSVGTLFVGSAHREILPNGKKNETAEVITLSLTFDHRVVNGAGAANFAHEIKEQIEHFRIPATTAAASSEKS